MFTIQLPADEVAASTGRYLDIDFASQNISMHVSTWDMREAYATSDSYYVPVEDDIKAEHTPALMQAVADELAQHPDATLRRVFTLVLGWF